jgi:hypothetical protein
LDRGPSSGTSTASTPAAAQEQQKRLRQDLEEIRSLAARLDYERRAVKMLEAGYLHSWKNKLLGITGLAERIEKKSEGSIREGLQPDHLHHVLKNVLSNAMRFGTEGT